VKIVSHGHLELHLWVNRYPQVFANNRSLLDNIYILPNLHRKPLSYKLSDSACEIL